MGNFLEHLKTAVNTHSNEKLQENPLINSIYSFKKAIIKYASPLIFSFNFGEGVPKGT